LIVLQTHISKDGKPKLVDRLSLPPTALRCTHRVISELGVFDPQGDHFACVERAPGVDEETIRTSTGAPVEFLHRS
jgi:acyl CoA:acetate/3-ketoacid CoA transferase beta subunit